MVNKQDRIQPPCTLLKQLTRSIDTITLAVERGKMSQAMLKRSEMLKIVGMGYTTVWRLEKDGKFPARKRLSVGRVGWLLSEVQEWMASRTLVAA